MMPMSPRGTTLAKPSGTPPMIAVPQSGPITKRPPFARLALERRLVLDRHIVGEDHDVEPELQRLARLGDGEVSRDRDQRQIGGGQPSGRRREWCATTRRPPSRPDALG